MESNETTIEISSKYEPIFKEIKTPIVLVSGGRGSAKSFTLSIFAEDRTWVEGERIVYARYTMMSAEISIKDEFREKIDLLGHSGAFKDTANRITNIHTGSDVIFRGIKTGSKQQTAAMKSIKDPTVLVIEEAEEIPSKQEFNKIRRSFRKIGSNIVIILVFNPPEETHWIWEEFFEGKHRTELVDGHTICLSEDPRVTHIHTTYFDNLKNLNEDFLEDARHTKQNNPDEYGKDFIGSWGTPRTGLEAYSTYKKSIHVGSCPFLPDLPVHLSHDQNVVPFIYTSLWQINYIGDKIQLRCFDEIALKPPHIPSATEQVCKAFISRWGDKTDKAYTYGDRNGNNRSTTTNLTDYKIIERELKEWLARDHNRVWRQNPPVAKRIDFICKVLNGDYEDIEIIVAPHCIHMQTDLAKVKRDMNGAKLKEKETKNGVSYEKYGHPSDTLDYIVLKVLNDLWRAFIAKKKKRRGGVRRVN